MGDFRLLDDEQPVSKIRAGRQQALLAYLILHRDAPQPRQYLAFQFWPDLPEEQSRNNLRQLLHQIRQDLPANERLLEVSASTVQWHPNPPALVDIIEFEEALDRANQAERSGNTHLVVANLEKAMHLYLGDLLPACYDDWIIPERDRLRQKCQDALRNLIYLLESKRAYHQATDYAQKLLALDNLDETTYRLLMRLHALNGDRTAAMRAYLTCAERLKAELGIEPEPETQALYQRLSTIQEGYPAPDQSAKGQGNTAPLIGRQVTWDQLLAAWQQASKQGPRCILLTGEAGIGKTRLAEELYEWTSKQGISTAWTRTYAAEGNLAFSPLVPWLESRPVRDALTHMDPIWLSEIARLLPDLLVSHKNLATPEPMKEHWQRQRFFQALTRAILSATQPMLLVLDDLQWCDADLLEWLHFLLRSDPQARLLLLGTLRVEALTGNLALKNFLLDLTSRGLVTEIAIEPLDAAETARLAESVLVREIQNETALRLFSETEGNPLFILETIQSGMLLKEPAQGTNQLEPPVEVKLSLPAKVQALIAARLSQLTEPARELASLAAIIGRAFSLEVLQHASLLDEEQFTGSIDVLWQHRIVRPLDDNLYDFTHDKIREVANAETSPARRRLFHRRIAQALETVNAHSLDTVAAQIAIHYDRAGLSQQAIPYYRMAARISQRIGSSEEAIRLLRRALALLNTALNGSEKDSIELDLLLALGVTLVDVQGHAAQEVLETYQRAQVICKQLGRPMYPPILRGLALLHITRAAFHEALEYGQQLLEQGEKQPDPVQIVEGHYVSGAAHIWLGHLLEGQRHLELSLAHYKPEQVQSHISLYSQDPRAICLVRLAFLQWNLGYADQAQRTSAEALAFAREGAHPFTLAYVLYWDVMLHNHLGAFDLAEMRAKELVAFCREQQVAYWLPQGEAQLGWIQAEQGDIIPGIARVQQGMEDFQKMGARMQQTFYLALLAHLHGKANDPDAGLKLLNEALKTVDRYDEHWFEAEIYRCQGELLAQKGAIEEAVLSFHRSMDIACQQGAKMLELRAANGLGQLLTDEGQNDQAQKMIAPLVEWFQEGLTLPDLVAARRLMHQDGRRVGQPAD